MAAVATFPANQGSAGALARRLSELIELDEQERMPEAVRDQVIVFWTRYEPALSLSQSAIIVPYSSSTTG